jgi:hypothetical protein
MSCTLRRRLSAISATTFCSCTKRTGVTGCVMPARMLSGVNLPSVAVRSMGGVHLFLLHLAVTGNENGRAFAEGAAVVFLRFA